MDTIRRVKTLVEWESFQKEEKEGFIDEGHEEHEGLEEVVEHADERELFMVKRVLAGLQSLEQEPYEVSSPTKKETTMLASSSPLFKLPQISP